MSVSAFPYGTIAKSGFVTVMTAGAQPQNTGFLRGSFGSLDPDSLFRGETIMRIHHVSSTNLMHLGFDTTGLPNDDTTFRQIIIDGYGTFNRADGTYDPNDPLTDTSWSWSIVQAFLASQQYKVTLL